MSRHVITRTVQRLTALGLSLILMGGCSMNDPDRPDTASTAPETTSAAAPSETEATAASTSTESATQSASEPVTASTTESRPSTPASSEPGAPDARFTPADSLDPYEQPYFYKNPARINNIGDPFIIRDRESGQYTCIATSASIGYYGWPSDDLIHWGSRKFVYQRPDDAWSTDSYWAPEVIDYRDKYYMFYTARHTRGSLLISVAVADRAEGPYVDVSDEPVFDPGYAIIDASVFVDDDGTPYLFYARDVSENVKNGKRVSEIWGVELAEDLLSTVGEAKLLLAPDQMWENPLAPEAWNEGPILLKHDGTYYLAYSANFFASPAYSVGYATSDAPLGDYTKADENPVLMAGILDGISGSGHHSYVHSPNGEELFTAYHTHTLPQAPSGNRQLALDRVRFTEDGKLVVNGPTLGWLPAPSTDTVRLLAPEDYAAVEGTKGAAALTDGLLAIHSKDGARDVVLDPADDGAAEITLTLTEPRALTSLVLVAGSGHHANIGRIELLLDDTSMDLGAFLPEGPESHTFAGIFPMTTTDTVRFRFHPEDPDQPMVLSEIYLQEAAE